MSDETKVVEVPSKFKDLVASIERRRVSWDCIARVKAQCVEPPDGFP